MVRVKIVRRYTHTVHRRRDAERGGMWVTGLEGGYEECKDACARGAAGVTVGCQGIVTRINLAPLHSLHGLIRIRDRVVANKPVCQKRGIEGTLTRAFSIASTLIHPGRSSPVSVSPEMTLMSSVRVTSGPRTELGRELLEQEEDNTGAAEGKRASGALGERF